MFSFSLKKTHYGTIRMFIHSSESLGFFLKSIFINRHRILALPAEHLMWKEFIISVLPVNKS